ncbi:hypothetical protein SAMN04489712_12116 [Thermomonospora echinospora]|uniref:Uncharacterized protein n=1 Tax=Thermomonospora echinospora TaxID=1992 RepID=A0A1H6DTB6_9ACTN|nr:hypothetical protein [Thermomonospora echinospora]SEG87845.1 hypothetical protein SAMN04489712_12116 [Thermomonospora echinospora]
MGNHDNTGDRNRPGQPIPPDRDDKDNIGGGGSRGSDGGKDK